MRILFLITGLGVGGAERQVVDLSDRIVERGHVVRICYLTGGAKTLPRNPAVELIGIGIEKSVIDLLRAWCALRRVIAEFRPDVVHSHMVHANVIARLLRLTLHMPRLVCTAHNTNEGSFFRMWLYRVTDSLADLTTNVSDEAVAAFVEKGAVKSGRIVAVPNGIDTERFCNNRRAREAIREREGVLANEKIILAVGRLTEAKDYPNLLAAYLSIGKASHGTRLWIVGDGELRSELQKRVNDAGASDRVKFWGIRTDVAEFMNAADVFVLSSAWEGFGLVVAEAMACEKVVVATDAGGVKEVLGGRGFLVPTRDSKALARALRLALELSEAEAAIAGRFARERVVSEYSLESAVMRWLSIYMADAIA